MAPQNTSFTAYVVAASVAKLGASPRWQGVVSGEAARLSEAFARHGADSWVRRLLYYLPLKAETWVMDRCFVPGMTQHFGLRKRFIEDQVLRRAGDGAQLIVLGAGFDTLALRTAKTHPAIQCFEIDLPATQAFKQSVLQSVQEAVPPNCHFAPADLGRQTLAQSLGGQSCFQADAPTVIVLEGVLMYLSKPEVTELFQHLHGLFTGPLTVVFGATVASDDAGNVALRGVNALLRTSKEGTKWYCPSAALAPWMESLGFLVTERITYKALQCTMRSEAELCRVPEEDENYYVAEKR